MWSNVSYCRYVVILLIVGGVFWGGCRNDSIVSPDAADFEMWFVGTSATVPEWLEGCTGEQIDSLVQKLRGTSAVGQRTVTLSDTAGRSFAVGYRTPAVLQPDTTYPLIIYLHGGTGTSRSDKGERAFDMYSFIADTLPVFIASPSANRDAYWWSPSGLSRILQTVRYMLLHYPVDPRKIVCAGVSDGATGCYAIANTIAAPFAGFIAVSGFGGMLEQLGMQLYPENIMQRPLYNINGAEDHLYPLSAVNRFLDRIEKSGVGILRKVYEQEGHGFEYRNNETATIGRLLNIWNRPEQRGGTWHFNFALPWAVRNVLEARPKAGRTDFSLVAGEINDTITVKADGAASVIMYFTEEDLQNTHCVRSGNKKCVRSIRAPWQYDFRVMKAQCIPKLERYRYYSFER